MVPDRYTLFIDRLFGLEPLTDMAAKSGVEGVLRVQVRPSFEAEAVVSLTAGVDGWKVDAVVGVKSAWWAGAGEVLRDRRPAWPTADVERHLLLRLHSVADAAVRETGCLSYAPPGSPLSSWSVLRNAVRRAHRMPDHVTLDGTLILIRLADPSCPTGGTYEWGEHIDESARQMRILRLIAAALRSAGLIRTYRALRSELCNPPLYQKLGYSFGVLTENLLTTFTQVID